MALIVGVPRETAAGERRVAMVPADLPRLLKAGLEVVVEAGAGLEAGYRDSDYTAKGASIAASRAEVFERAGAIVQVRAASTNPAGGEADLRAYRDGQAVVGFFDPLMEAAAVERVASTGAVAFAMELMPRITRAQSMDALSSMATVSGYLAVIRAADRLPKLFPMLMTAAGTLAPAKVFVIGAGVAGLQAIATARRLGAVVHAYDVRSAAREQVESLGGKFVELPLETAGAEDKGGYAKALGEEFYRKQRELLGRVVAESDVVITTAAVPGRKSPVLVTAEMVAGMAPGSVIVDLAAERGGNCELTQADQEICHNGVTILGPTDLPSCAAYHASQMYSRNITNFLLLLCKNGSLQLDSEDEVIRETMLSRGGAVVHPRLLQLLGQSTGA